MTKIICLDRFGGLRGIHKTERRRDLQTAGEKIAKVQTAGETFAYLCCSASNWIFIFAAFFPADMQNSERRSKVRT